MKKIESFDGLRAVLACSIFLNHCTFLKSTRNGDYIFEHIFHNGGFAVTLFFILSGFCMVLGYRNKFEEITSEKYIAFMRKRLIKFYPLYIFSMILSAFLISIREGFEKALVIKIAIAASLLQSLTERTWSVLNSVGWFLSTLTMLYLITPWLLHLTGRCDVKKLIKFLLLSILSIVCMDICWTTMENHGIISKKLNTFLTYIFPAYRFPEYFGGILLGRVFLYYPLDISNIKASILESIMIMMCVLVYFVGLNAGSYLSVYREIAYVICGGGIIVLLGYNKGIISWIFCRTMLKKIGAISMEIYLIHYPLINFGGVGMLNRLINLNIEKRVWLIVLILFMITLIFSLGLKYILNKVIGRKKV